MRSVVATLLCCGLLSLSGCAGGAPGKLADCRGDDALLEGVPVGWTGSGTDLNLFQVGLDTGEAHGGEASLSVFSRRAGRENWMQLSQIIEAGDFAGQRVRFRAFVTASNVGKSYARKYETRPSLLSYPANLDFEAKVPANQVPVILVPAIQRPRDPKTP